jgi:DNA-binding Lrp family transcriptional regulator
MSLEPRDYTVIGYFRHDARTTLTDMSKTTQIPVSTIYDKLQRFEERDIIKRHTSLVNFDELGYDIRVYLLLTVDQGDYDGVEEFLDQHRKVNNVLRTSNGYDYIAEAIFHDMEEYDEFFTALDEEPVDECEQHFVMDEVKREAFMKYDDALGVKR